MSVSFILHPNVNILDQFLTSADAIKLVKDHSIRSMLVTNTKKRWWVWPQKPIFFIDSLHKPLTRVVPEEIVSTPIIFIPPDMAISDALSVIAKHVIRQIVVYSGNTVFELIISDDIIVKMEKALVETIDAFRIESPLCIWILLHYGEKIHTNLYALQK